MELRHITITECPSCRSHVIEESCRHRHTNGEGFEVRGFACGYTVEWSPNFSRLLVTYECPKSPTTIARDKKRNAAIVALKQAIADLDVDEPYKEYLLDHGIKYCSIVYGR